MREAVSSLIQPKVTFFGPKGFLSWDAYESLKGLLILFIAMGHNSILTGVFPNLDWYLYNFHVSSFLMVSFLFRPEPFTASANRDKLVRYLVPFAICVLLLAPIKWLVQEPPVDVWTSLQSIVLGLLFGTAPLLKEATGFNLFWFLPTIALLAVVRSWYYWLSPKGAGFALLGIIALELILSWYKVHIDYMPFGFPIVLYIFPLGLIGVILARICFNSDWQKLVFIGLLVCLWLLENGSLDMGYRMNLSMGVKHGLHVPAPFILLKALVVVGFLCCLMASRYLAGLKFLRVLGKYSLLVYLSHSLIYQTLLLLANWAGFDPFNFVAGVLSLMLTLGLAIALSALVQRVELLRNLVTPRDYASFKSVFTRSHA